MGKPCCATAMLLLIMVLSGCSDEEPIRIGFLAGTSGRAADSGISSRDAVQLAVEECNQSGGIAGRKVHLIVKDDQDHPEKARQALARMIDDGAVAVIGPITSQIALAVTPLANERKVPLISPTAAADALSGKEDYFFRMAPSRRRYAKRSADYLIQTAGIRRVAAVYDRSNSAYTESWIGSFKQSFQEMGGQLIAAIGFSAQDNRSFLSIAGELLALKPDGILIVANSMDSALMCQQIRKLNPHVAITLSDWGGTERLLSLGGRAVEGVTCVDGFDRRSQAPRFLAFRQTYLERFRREPGFTAINSYDAFQVILAALRVRQGAQSLQDAILGTASFNGLQGDFAFDRSGDAQRPLISIGVVHDRQLVVLE